MRSRDVANVRTVAEMYATTHVVTAPPDFIAIVHSSVKDININSRLMMIEF